MTTRQKVKRALQNPRILIYRPFSLFTDLEVASGILLVLGALLALILANSPLAESFHHLLEDEIALGPLVIESPLHFVNDALMAIFFLVVGLEIKREFLIGELATASQRVLPIVAALGGMLVPAGIYSIVISVSGAPAADLKGWGIPMATDIAFALGILMLLGRRVPLSLKVFLTAVAIVDDLGAIVVIAVFYTNELVMSGILIAVVSLLALVVLNRLGARNPIIYIFFGVILWAGVATSGIHATIAGVMLAMTIPASTRIDTSVFHKRANELLDQFESAGIQGKDIRTNPHQFELLLKLESLAEEAQAPLQRLEHSLRPYIMYAIMPVFALANAGVTIDGSMSDFFTQPVTWGIVLGLVLGKPIGILSAVYLSVRLGWGRLPNYVRWPQMIGVGFLAGIGFTMSLFITGLAFATNPHLIDVAKIGILLASLIAGVTGVLILVGTSRIPSVVPAESDAAGETASSNDSSDANDSAPPFENAPQPAIEGKEQSEQERIPTLD